MNGINAPKVVECFGSDGHKYRQLAKSGNDDLRQDAVRFYALLYPTLKATESCFKFAYSFSTFAVFTCEA